MPIDENDLAYEFFEVGKEDTAAQEADAKAKADALALSEAEKITNSAKETADAEAAQAEVDRLALEEQNKVKTADVEYKSKKYIPVDDEKDLYDRLDKKYNHERMKPEEKALAFIKQQNPELDDNEILFIAANEYGIGVEKPDETLLTDAQVLELKKQDISRKKLLSQADNYFKEEAGKVELPGADPLELDPAYKAYQESTAKQAEARTQQEQQLQSTIKQIDKNVKEISDLKEPIEIDIDDSKFAIDVNFKLDDKKQKQLADYVKQYIPSDAEIAAFTDTDSGKFDWKGYMSNQATKVFAKDMIKAAVRQALSQDRDSFRETHLKNSTLGTNYESKQVTKDFDIVDAWPFGT
jgi:hypothetical protein